MLQAMNRLWTLWLRQIGLGFCLLALLFLPAAAQNLPPRLALVIGIADYPEQKHPTAPGDAALVAATLKAAGFEVQEGANLTEGEFRAAFRRFLDAANAAGPDATIALYLAGFGLQDEGDAYFIPAGARLRQRSDLSTEALRLGDFLRGLAGLPSRQKIVMIDAAYQSPFLALVADGPRGLPAFERQPGFLIGLNHAPGQAAPLPRTAFGHYAMALAEALREPGLALNAAFDRVRLRVHDLSAGAETPWHDNALGTATPLVAALATPAPLPAPAEPRPQRPAIEIEADEAYARAIAEDTIRGYESFLRAFPNHRQAKRVRGLLASKREQAFWQRTRRTNSEQAYWTYLQHYPRGAHVAEARRRLARLNAPEAWPTTFVPVIYDDLAPPPPEEIEIYETIVVEEAWESIPAPFVEPVGLLPPPPVEIIELEPPPPSLGARLLPAIPVAIAGAYVAHRLWKRPRVVHDVYVPPPPVRPPLQPGFTSVRPGYVQPLPPGRSAPLPRAPDVRPGFNAPLGGPAGLPGRPGAIPSNPGSSGVPPNVPVVRPPDNKLPATPPVVTAPVQPGQKPGSGPVAPVQPPARPGETKVPPAAAAVPPPDLRGQQPVRPVPQVQPSRGTALPPQIQRPTPPRPPGAGPVPPRNQANRPVPQINREGPVIRQQPVPGYRPPPPGYRPPPPNFQPGAASPPPGRGFPASQPRPSFQGQPQPVFRPTPQVQRPQPPQPVFRPVPQPQPVARPAPVPAPQARPNPACNDKMRALRQC